MAHIAQESMKWIWDTEVREEFPEQKHVSRGSEASLLPWPVQ